MSEAAPRNEVSFADAAHLDPDEQGGELDHGEWVPVTRNTWRHGEVTASVVALLKLWARTRPGYSVATGDPGTKLGHDPDLLRGPDVAVVRAERRPVGRGEAGWLEGAPDLAVEIAGDAQSIAGLTRKALEYLRAGAKQVWIVDIEARRVVALTPPDHVRVLGPDDELDGGEAAPAFSCRVTELFE